jgi:hypothetical protein
VGKQHVPIIVVRPQAESLKLATHQIDSQNTTRGETLGHWFSEFEQAVNAKELGQVLVITVPEAAGAAYRNLLNAVAAVNPDVVHRQSETDAGAKAIEHWCDLARLDTWAVFRWHWRENRLACECHGVRVDDAIMHTQWWNSEFIKTFVFPARDSGPIWVSQARRAEQAATAEQELAALSLGCDRATDPAGSAYVRILLASTEFHYCLLFRTTMSSESRDFLPVHRYLVGLLQQIESAKPRSFGDDRPQPIGVAALLRKLIDCVEGPQIERRKLLGNLFRDLFEHRNSQTNFYVGVHPLIPGERGGYKRLELFPSPDLAPIQIELPVESARGVSLAAVAASRGRSLCIDDLSASPEYREAHRPPHEAKGERWLPKSHFVAMPPPPRSDKKWLQKAPTSQLDYFACTCEYTDIGARGADLRLCEAVLDTFHQLQALYVLGQHKSGVHLEEWAALRKFIQKPQAMTSDGLMQIVCDQLRALVKADLCYFLRRDSGTRHFRSHAVSVTMQTVGPLVKQMYDAEDSHLALPAFVAEILRYRLLPRRFGRTTRIVETGQPISDSIPDSTRRQNVYDQLRWFRDFVGFPFGSDLGLKPEGVIWLRWIDIGAGLGMAARTELLKRHEVLLLKTHRFFLEAAACVYTLLRRAEEAVEDRIELQGARGQAD